MSKPRLVLDPVGPPPGSPSTGDSQGSLIVFSAFDVHAHFGMDRQFHTDYEIFSEDGKQSCEVQWKAPLKLSQVL